MLDINLDERKKFQQGGYGYKDKEAQILVESIYRSLESKKEISDIEIEDNNKQI